MKGWEQAVYGDVDNSKTEGSDVELVRRRMGRNRRVIAKQQVALPPGYELPTQTAYIPKYAQTSPDCLVGFAVHAETFMAYRDQVDLLLFLHHVRFRGRRPRDMTARNRMCPTTTSGHRMVIRHVAASVVEVSMKVVVKR
jgi:hypothetical protein